MEEKKVPLVSVCMVIYNHERYIAQAIEGVLMQQTDFPIELVIGEDCSTDRTQKICLEYKRKFPDSIRLLLNRRNIGMMPNLIQVLKTCHGKYIALCDGDDYWTDSFKLQKQVDFLEEHPECSACFHNVQIDFESNKQNNHNRYELNQVKQFITYEDLLGGSNPINTVSLLFRREFIDPLPEWFSSVNFGDYALIILLSKNGPIGYINEVMGCYRIHDKGIYSQNGFSSDREIYRIESHLKFWEILRKNKVVSRKQYQKVVNKWQINKFSFFLKVRKLLPATSILIQLMSKREYLKSGLVKKNAKKLAKAYLSHFF